MANILSLAMKVSADASGVVKNLTPAERALEKLGQQADKTAEVFAQFAKTNEAASRVLLQSRTDFAFLTSALKTGQITAQQFAEEYAKLKAAAESTSAAFKEGLEVQRQYGNELVNRAAEVDRLVELYKLGAIDLDALNNATIAALGLDEKATESAKQRADEYARLQAEADAIRKANLTAQEEFNQAVGRAAVLRDQGVLTEELYTREVGRQAALFAKATAAADGFGKSIDNAAKNGLKLNELSGILSVLPGPLGNIAGRFSGISSAAEGLNRVFSGGLRSGIASVGTQLAGLANPVTVAVAAFTAFGTAAAAVVRGLAALDERIEQLSNAALRLGTDFQTIQILDEAAKRGGISIDALAAGIQKLSVNIDEARSGTGKAAEAFRELGISQEELANLDPAELAQRTSQALQGIVDPARRAALATETLGKAGLTLLPGFNAIAESEESLRRFSAAISEIDRDRISSLGSSFDNVKISLSTLGRSALLPFAGIVEGVANLFADIVGSVTRVAQAIGFVLTPVLDSIGNAFNLLSSGLATVNGAFDWLVGNTPDATAEVGKLRNEIESPLEDNFAKEFANDLQRIQQSLSDAIDESAAFGQAGFNAALQYQESIRELQAQLDDGLINEETFRRAAARAGDAFRDEIARLENDAKIELQIEADAQATVAGLRAEISQAIDEATQFGQAGFDAALQFQNKLEELRQQFEAGVINEETLRRGVAAANAEYDAQIDKVKQLQNEQRRLIDADRARIEGLLEANSAAVKLEQDLQAVQREQARVSEQLAAARAAGNAADADAAAARQAELDQLQGKLEDQQLALEQGFGQGFQAAFQSVDENINALIAKSQEFGQAGFDAALRLQQGIAAAQEQASAGILNQEAFNVEVARQQELFNNEIKHLEDVRKKKEDDNRKAIADQKKAQDDALRLQERYADQQRQAAEAAAKEQQRVQEQIFQYQQKVLEEQQKAAEAEAKRQEERLKKLNTLGSQTITGSDIRTAEGAALVLNLTANAQDPRLVQERLQTKLLERIATGIGQAASNYFNQPVAIVGYSSFGEPR